MAKPGALPLLNCCFNSGTICGLNAMVTATVQTSKAKSQLQDVKQSEKLNNCVT